MSKKSNHGVFIFIVIFICVCVGVFFAYINTPLYTSAGSKYSLRFNQKDFIAEVHIEGVMEEANKTYNQKWLIDTIQSLKSDSANKGILLYIDSPGGGVYQADEVYLSLLDYKKSSGNPVVAYFGPLAASGGYYVACSASTIYANRNTLTGSIGVIAGSSVDATEFLSKLGIKVETFTAGKNKNMLNFDSPLSSEQRAIMQSIADEAYEQFVGIVAQSRNLNVQNVKRLADGRIYTALQAKQNGLIDEIATLEEAKEALKKRITSECKTVVYKYEKKQGVFESLMEYSSKNNASTQVKEISDEIKQILGKNIPYPAYLYSTY